MSDKQPDSAASDDRKGKRRGKGLWWKIPLGLLVLLIVLVLLLPTIAGTGPVRNFVLGKINASAPGKLAVSDWSFGWFSGAKLSGVEWTDAQGRKLASVGEIETPITVLQLARGDLHFGEITIRHITADVVVPMGKKPASPPAPGGAGGQATKPISLPDVAAKVRVEDIGGQITFVGENGRSEAIKLDRSTRLLLDMPGGGSPVKCDALVALAQPGGTGNVSLAGAVNGIKPGPLDVKQLSGDGAIKLTGVDLDQVAAILRAMGQDLAIRGTLSGQVVVASPQNDKVTAKGELSADNVVATVGKDQLSTAKLRIPVDAEISGGGDSARAVVRELGIAIDQASIAMTADLPLKAIEDLQNNRAPTQSGVAHLVASVPSLPVLMNSLPGAFKLRQGVQVTGGQFACEAKVDIGPSGLAVSVPLTIKELAATEDGRKIGPLQPVSLNAAARLSSLRATPNAISDISLVLTSSFANLSAKGATIAALNAKGDCDLVKMRGELGEIVDLSMIRGGRMTLDLSTRDGTADTLSADLKLLVADLGINLRPAQGGTPRHVEGASLSVTAQATYQGKKLGIKEPLVVDVGGKLFEDAPGRPPRLLLDQTARLTVSGMADLGASPGRVTLDQFSLDAGKGLLSVGLPPNRPLELTLAGARGVTTDARLLVNADLAALQELQSQLAPTTQPAGKLAKGLFSGELFCTIASDGSLKAGLGQSTTTIDYTSGQQRYTDTIAAAASASLSADASTAGIAAQVQGKLLNLALDATAGLSADAQGARQLKTLQVSKLDARSEYGDVNLTAPIVISDVPALMGVFKGGDLPENAKVAGELTVKSDLAKLLKASSAAASAKQISGVLTSKQTISLKQRDIVADIAGEVASLKVTSAGKAIVEEPKLTIGGRLRVNPSAKWMQFNQVAITSASGMINLKAFVRINELGSQNRIENGKLELTPDWAKLWPVIFAMMPPENQAKIGEMLIAGKKTNTITFDGSFPSNKPSSEAIKLLRASGDLTFEQIDWKTHGIVLSGTIPFRLEQGLAHFDYGRGKPTVPLACNEGKIDIAKATIDLTGDAPRLDIPPQTRIASDVKLNSVLLSSLGKFSNPLFVDSERASGVANITVIECNRLALGEKMYDPTNGGRAEIRIDLTNLDVASKGVNNVLGAMDIKPEKGSDRVVGEIKDGRVTIADGRCVQKMNVQLGDKTFAFDGNMGLANVTYSLLNVGVPRDLVAKMLDNWFHVPQAENYLPEYVDLRFSGPASALKLDRSTLAALSKDVLAQQGTRAVLGGLLGKKEKASTTPSSKQPPEAKVPASKPAGEDVIGDLLQGLTRPKGKK